jgi:hypothetical protein
MKQNSMLVSKFVFVITCSIIVLIGSFSAGFYTAYTRTGLFESIREARNAIKLSLDVLRVNVLSEPIHHLQRARHQGGGVTRNLHPDDGSLILLSGLFNNGNELRLIRRNGDIVVRWPVSFSTLFPNTQHMEQPPATDWNVDIHGALVEADGSVVFNFENGGLVKLDRCGKTTWTVSHPTHHSVERAKDGSYWVPGRRYVTTGESEYPPFEVPYKEDLIINVSKDGKIVSEASVPAILYENGLEALFTATGNYVDREFITHWWDRELVHLNKIEILDADLAVNFPQFEAGDLLLSFRDLNLILVANPETFRIKWHQTGPWLRQHDPEFDTDGTITVFNNNTYNVFQRSRYTSNLSTAPRTSNIVRVDPRTGRTEIEFGQLPGQEMLSVIRGKHEITDSGGFLITEFEAGRVFETDSNGNIVWEYINRYDDQRVGEITEARLYPAAYFDVKDWTCR